MFSRLYGGDLTGPVFEEENGAGGGASGDAGGAGDAGNAGSDAGNVADQLHSQEGEGSREPGAAEKEAAAKAEAEAKAKADADAAAKDKAGKDGQDGEAGEYKDFNIPEGIEVNSELMTGFKSWGQKNKVSQEAMQELADLHTGWEVGRSKAATEEWEGRLAGWLDDSKADKEIGGENFEENVSIASSAITAFGDDEVRAQMDATGLGNHPAFIRMFHKIGKLIKDGDILEGSVGDKGGLAKKSAADLMFGDEK